MCKQKGLLMRRRQSNDSFKTTFGFSHSRCSAYLTARVRLWGNGPKVVPRDGHHDAPGGSIGAPRAHCPVSGERLIRAILVAHLLQMHITSPSILAFLAIATYMEWSCNGPCDFILSTRALLRA